MSTVPKFLTGDSESLAPLRDYYLKNIADNNVPEQPHTLTSEIKRVNDQIRLRFNERLAKSNNLVQHSAVQMEIPSSKMSLAATKQTLEFDPAGSLCETHLTIPVDIGVRWTGKEQEGMTSTMHSSPSTTTHTNIRTTTILSAQQDEPTALPHCANDSLARRGSPRVPSFMQQQLDQGTDALVGLTEDLERLKRQYSLPQQQQQEEAAAINRYTRTHITNTTNAASSSINIHHNITDTDPSQFQYVQPNYQFGTTGIPGGTSDVVQLSTNQSYAMLQELPTTAGGCGVLTPTYTTSAVNHCHLPSSQSQLVGEHIPSATSSSFQHQQGEVAAENSLPQEQHIADGPATHSTMPYTIDRRHHSLPARTELCALYNTKGVNATPIFEHRAVNTLGGETTEAACQYSTPTPTASSRSTPTVTTSQLPTETVPSPSHSSAPSAFHSSSAILPTQSDLPPSLGRRTSSNTGGGTQEPSPTTTHPAYPAHPHGPESIPQHVIVSAKKRNANVLTDLHQRVNTMATQIETGNVCRGLWTVEQMLKAAQKAYLKCHETFQEHATPNLAYAINEPQYQAPTQADVLHTLNNMQSMLKRERAQRARQMGKDNIRNNHNHNHHHDPKAATPTQPFHTATGCGAHPFRRTPATATGTPTNPQLLQATSAPAPHADHATQTNRGRPSAQPYVPGWMPSSDEFRIIQAQPTRIHSTALQPDLSCRVPLANTAGGIAKHRSNSVPCRSRPNVELRPPNRHHYACHAVVVPSFKPGMPDRWERLSAPPKGKRTEPDHYHWAGICGINETNVHELQYRELPRRSNSAGSSRLHVGELPATPAIQNEEPIGKGVKEKQQQQYEGQAPLAAVVAQPVLREKQGKQRKAAKPTKHVKSSNLKNNKNTEGAAATNATTKKKPHNKNRKAMTVTPGPAAARSFHPNTATVLRGHPTKAATLPVPVAGSTLNPNHIVIVGKSPQDHNEATSSNMIPAAIMSTAISETEYQPTTATHTHIPVTIPTTTPITVLRAMEAANGPTVGSGGCIHTTATSSEQAMLDEIIPPTPSPPHPHPHHPCPQPATKSGPAYTPVTLTRQSLMSFTSDDPHIIHDLIESGLTGQQGQQHTYQQSQQYATQSGTQQKTAKVASIGTSSGSGQSAAVAIGTSPAPGILHSSQSQSATSLQSNPSATQVTPLHAKGDGEHPSSWVLGSSTTAERTGGSKTRIATTVVAGGVGGVGVGVGGGGVTTTSQEEHTTVTDVLPPSASQLSDKSNSLSTSCSSHHSHQSTASEKTMLTNSEAFHAISKMEPEQLLAMLAQMEKDLKENVTQPMTTTTTTTTTTTNSELVGKRSQSEDGGSAISGVEEEDEYPAVLHEQLLTTMKQDDAQKDIFHRVSQERSLPSGSDCA